MRVKSDDDRFGGYLSFERRDPKKGAANVCKGDKPFIREPLSHRITFLIIALVSSAVFAGDDLEDVSHLSTEISPFRELSLSDV